MQQQQQKLNKHNIHTYNLQSEVAGGEGDGGACVRFLQRAHLPHTTRDINQSWDSYVLWLHRTHLRRLPAVSVEVGFNCLGRWL